jgi:hypothetical protein
MSHNSVVHITLLKITGSSDNTHLNVDSHSESQGLIILAKNTPSTPSKWQQFTESLPFFKTTQGEKKDTGSRLNLASRFGVQVSLPVLGILLNYLSSSKYNKAIDFLKHYTYGRGADYILEVPIDWQSAIASRYKKPGTY